jgi:hypothetical protein
VGRPKVELLMGQGISCILYTEMSVLGGCTGIPMAGSLVLGMMVDSELNRKYK